MTGRAARAGRAGRRRGRALVVVLLVLLAGPALQASPASAHAYVIATSPSNGAEVNASPAEVRVTFDEPVTLPSYRGSASVLDPVGKNVGSGSVHLVDGRRTLVIGVRPGLAKDSYIASWSVISADTHPVGGSIQFGYGVPAVAVPAPTSAQPSAGLELLVGIVKGLLYLGLVAALGLLPAALVLGADPGERRLVWRAARIGAGLSILASLLQVGGQYLWDASAVPGGDTWNGLGHFAGSAYSEAILVRIGLLAAALVGLPPLRVVVRGHRLLRGWWVFEGVLALAVLGSLVHNGHGGTGAWWHFVSTLVHVSAAVAWLGGLAVLGLLVLRRRMCVRRLLRLPLWSRYAATSVGLLALTGLLQGLVQVRRPAALVSTTYGDILIVKLVLVAVTLLLGLRGNRWVSGQLALAGVKTAGGSVAGGAATDRDAGDQLIPPGQTAWLRTRVRTEAGIGAVIVIVSGVLSSVTPAAVAYAPRRVVHTTIGPYAVTIAVAPGRRGPESFRITAAGRTEATTPAQSVQLDLGQPTGAVRALPVSFPYRLPGLIRVGQPTGFTFVSSAVNVPDTGVWTGTLTLVAGPTEEYVADFTYRVI